MDIIYAMVKELSERKHANKYFIECCYDYMIRKGYKPHPKSKDECVKEVISILNKL